MNKNAFFVALLAVIIALTAATGTFAAVSDDAALGESETRKEETNEAEEWAPDSDNAIDELMTSLTKARSFDGEAYGLKGNYAVLQMVDGKLETNGGIDHVRLIAFRKEDGVYNRSLLLEVTPSEEKPYLIPLPRDAKGLDARIELKNFISADKFEILLTLHGDPRARRFFVIEAGGRQGRILYDSQTTKLPSIEGKFHDKYRAEIWAKETSTRALIDLSPRKTFYIGKLVYHESTG